MTITGTPKKSGKTPSRVQRARGRFVMLEDKAKNSKLSSQEEKDYNQAAAIIANYEKKSKSDATTTGETPMKTPKKTAVKKKAPQTAPPKLRSSSPVKKQPTGTAKEASTATAAVGNPGAYYPEDVAFSPPARFASGVPTSMDAQEPVRKRTRTSTAGISDGRVATPRQVTPLGGRGTAFTLSEANTPTAKASYRSGVRMDTPFPRKTPSRLDDTETKEEEFFTPEPKPHQTIFGFPTMDKLPGLGFGDNFATNVEPKKSNFIACSLRIVSAVLGAVVAVVLVGNQPILSSTWAPPMIVGAIAFLAEFAVAKAISLWKEKNYLELSIAGAVPALIVGLYMLDKAN